MSATVATGSGPTRHTVDSSVLVAGFASWHEHHVPARRALQGAVMIGHALLESYSVLTRMPPPHRVPGSVAAAFLDRVTTSTPLTLGASSHGALPSRLAGAAVTGGATYDALIAATAAEAGVALVSLDARAATTYRALGVEHRLLL